MRERILPILALAALVLTLAPSAAVAQAASRPVDPAPVNRAPGAAVVVTIDGPVDDYTRDRLFKRFEEARALGADTVILRVDTYGGLVTAGLDISRFLKRQDDLRVIAYVDDKAISAGAMIALAADEIVMKPGATIGNAAPIAVSGGGLVPLG